MSTRVATAGITGPVPFAVGVGLISLLAGGVLGVLGGRGGPAVVVAAPLVILGLLWALNRPLVAVALVPLSLPVGLTTIGAGLQLIEVLLVAATGVVLAYRLAAGRGPLPFPAEAWWAVALVTLLLLATPAAASRSGAVRQDITVLISVVFGLAVIEACRSLDDVRLIAGLVVAAGGSMCALALPKAASISATGGGAVVTAQLTGTFTEKNQLGSISVTVVLLAAGLYFGAQRTRTRYAAGVMLVIGLLTVLLSLSRGAWIGLIFGGFTLLVLLPQARRALILVGLPVTLAVLVLVVATPDQPQVTIVRDRLGSFADPSANPYDDRPAIWREAVRQIGERPWLGQGPASFPVVSRRSVSEATFAFPQHAHNVLLTVAAEVGLFGVAAVVALTIGVGLTALRTVRALAGRRDAAIVAAVAAALAAYAGQGLVDYILRNEMLIAVLFLLIGLVFAAARWVGERDLSAADGRDGG